MCQLTNIIYNFFYSSGKRNLLTLLLYLTYTGSNLAAIYGKEEIVQLFFEKIFLFIFGSFGLLYFIWMLRRINQETLQSIYSKNEQKMQLEMIVQNIEESLITIQQDKVR